MAALPAACKHHAPGFIPVTAKLVAPPKLRQLVTTLKDREFEIETRAGCLRLFSVTCRNRDACPAIASSCAWFEAAGKTFRL